MHEIINICAKLKASVVNKDRLEGGLRKILNFGHTFAHPIETLSNYKNFSHGEAVAHGIKYASKLAFDKKMIDSEYFDSILFLLNKFNLLDKKVKFDNKKIVDLMMQDKKVENSKINLVLPTNPSQVEVFDNIDRLSIEASLL